MRPRAVYPAHVLAVVADVLHPDKRPKVRAAPHDAEDLLQDALLLFVEKYDSVRPGSCHAWILGTLRNLERELFKEQALWKKYEPLLEAHLQEHAPWGQEPDVALRQQQVLFSVVWLLGQVAPTRRDVAERVLFDGLSLEAISTETNVPLGTVRSRWTRAKRDMRAALDRERAKLDGAFLAILLAILGAWCLWIGTKIRRGAGAVVAAYDRGRDAKSARSRGRRGGAVLACAVLPLVVLSHIAFGALDLSAGTSADEAHLDLARGDEHLVLMPYLTTNAERERGSGSGPAAVPPVAAADREVGRGLLNRANTAVQQGHDHVARDALQLYDEEYPQNPFPALRAQVVTALASRRSP